MNVIGKPTGNSRPFEGAVTATAGGRSVTVTVTAAVPTSPARFLTDAVSRCVPRLRCGTFSAPPVPSAPSRLERQATARVRTPSCASTAVAARATTSSSNTGVPVAGAVIVTCGRRDGSGRKVTTSRGGLPDSRLWYLTASADTLVRAKLYVPSRVTAAPTRKSTRCPCTTGVLSASSSAPLIVGRFMYVVVASDQVLLLIRRTAPAAPPDAVLEEPTKSWRRASATGTVPIPATAKRRSANFNAGKPTATMLFAAPKGVSGKSWSTYVSAIGKNVSMPTCTGRLTVATPIRPARSFACAVIVCTPGRRPVTVTDGPRPSGPSRSDVQTMLAPTSPSVGSTAVATSAIGAAFRRSRPASGCQIVTCGVGCRSVTTSSGAPAGDSRLR